MSNSRSPASASDGQETTVIERLTPKSMQLMRLPWHSRFTGPSVFRQLTRDSQLAFWVPATGEFILGEEWRNRSDILAITELHGRKLTSALLDKLVKAHRERSGRLVLLAEDVWRDKRADYEAMNFTTLESIVFYEKDLRNPEPRSRQPGEAGLQIRTLSSEVVELDLLMALDNDAFPWLWRNSAREFEVYRELDGVQIRHATLGNEPVGYASMTLYEGWAHLDRLAVARHFRGRGFGTALVLDALRIMAGRGSASVALSTQETNVASQRLYNTLGFRQLRDKMTFYGLALDEEVNRLLESQPQRTSNSYPGEP